MLVSWMKQRGFTLIELLVTIAVAVIMATIAVPNYQRLMAVSRVASDYNEVLSGLNYARSEAIKRRAEVTFSVTSGTPWSYRVSVDGMDDPIRVRSGRDSITSLDDDDFSVTFNALGKRESCDGDCSMSLTSTSSHAEDRSLTVNAMGRVSGGAA